MSCYCNHHDDRWSRTAIPAAHPGDRWVRARPSWEPDEEEWDEYDDSLDLRGMNLLVRPLAWFLVMLGRNIQDIVERRGY